MKKILALVLSFIMLLSVMPVAFAAEKSVMEEYIDEVVKLFIYCHNIYDNQEFNDYVDDTYFVEFRDYPGMSQWMAGTEEELPGKLEVLKGINAELEEKVVDGEFTVLVDATVFATAMAKYCVARDIYGMIYGLNVEEMRLYYFDNNDINYDEINADLEKLDEILYNNGAVTQEEFDALTKEYTYVLDLIARHAFGEHDFAQYIPNNDATEESPGTKTATCKICGATDTVVDEGSDSVEDGSDSVEDGSDLVEEEKENLSFFEKIIEFFKSIFDRILALFS